MLVDRGQILEKEADQPMQADRTRRGVCARCGVSDHGRDGKCKDGGGEFAWCFSRGDTKRLIGHLEGVLANAAEHKREGERPVNADARCVVDILATVMSGSLGKETPRQFLARLRGVEEIVGDVDERALGTLHCVLTSRPGVDRHFIVKLAEVFCGWPEARALEAIRRAEGNGWIQKSPDAAPPAASKA